jgi:hypothetical protein
MHIVSDAERAVNEACTGFWFRLEDAQALFGADELQYDPVNACGGDRGAKVKPHTFSFNG